ncbi:FAS-associated factor 2 [Agrilus planipennis]|uniref:FAS-associated factor 2 n=1 Tax=Agrilus planipennis TaxID=224129 RepID=A0A1W4WYR3_AGRPL|nr:FAS-associated factor 2 [Agrilus planipennis]
MDYPGDNAGLGLTGEQIDKIAQFQELSGIDDVSVCREVLQRHQWNVEVAIQEQLNIREGRPSVYASEARPPAVVSDHIGQHIFYSPPSDGSASGLRGFIRSILNFFWTVCYNTIVAFLQMGRRILRPDERGYITDPLQEVQDFIRAYNEKYSERHPVFYQGTYAQVLNDAKRELKFLLIYLHNEDAVDTNMFCRNTLANEEVISYINNFFFWACSTKSNEGYKVCQIFHPKHYPFLSVVVLKDNKMMIVSRMEGYCDGPTLIERLHMVVAENEVNLVRARAQRMETSLNRSLRQHQDEAFLESLRADQEKERRRQEEREAAEAERRRLQEEILAEERRREEIARLKIDSVVNVPSEPDISHPDAIHIVIKLPCGTRLDRRFLKTHSLEAVFYFVFCHPNSPDTFEITTNFPKRVLKCRPSDSSEIIQTLEEAGLKNREVLFINDLDA